MMKLIKAALLLSGIVLLAHGAEALYYAALSSRQVTLTCAQLVRQRPRAAWLRVTGCDVDYLGAGYRESGGHLRELFFPVRLPSQPPGSPIPLVVATADPQVLAIAEKTVGGSQQPDQESYLVMMLRVVTMLRAATEVEGYARSGLVERLQARRALSGLSAPLTPDFIALDLHAAPSWLRPGVETGLGLLLVVAAIAVGRGDGHGLRVEADGRRSPAAADSIPDDPYDRSLGRPAEPVAGDEVIAAALERRLPAVMLLDLEPDAGATEIERAPALGGRDEVGGRLAEIFGPLTASGDGRQRTRGAGWSVEFDLGRDERVWTIVAEARGNDGSVAAIAALAARTGWRIFMPRAGRFVEPGDLGTLARS